MVASIIRAAHVADFSELNNQVGVNWKLQIYEKNNDLMILMAP